MSRAAGGATLDEARAAKVKVQAALADRLEVTGIGITRHADGFAVKVDLSAPCDVPSSVSGVPVHAEVVGHVRKRRGA